MSRNTLSIPVVVPRSLPAVSWQRHALPAEAFRWLGAGWSDFRKNPLVSLAYGGVVFSASASLVLGLAVLGWDYILLPVLAGFLVVGPMFAVGLYDKSRRIAAGDAVDFVLTLQAAPKSGGQIAFIGVILSLLFAIWLRASVIIYALFFGLVPFPGFDQIVVTLVGTHTGWWMLLVGSCIGALLASFSFAISVFAIPMLLDRDVDAFTAMGTSMSLVTANLPVMLVWGAIVLGLFLLSLIPFMLGLIVVFPVLGHGTWHAYEAMRPTMQSDVESS